MGGDGSLGLPAEFVGGGILSLGSGSLLLSSSLIFPTLLHLVTTSSLPIGRDEVVGPR